MNHTYLQDSKGRIIDILFKYCDVSYFYCPKSGRIFDTPHDFYEATFISPPEKREPWEHKLLEQFRRLE